MSASIKILVEVDELQRLLDQACEFSSANTELAAKYQPEIDRARKVR
jgi:hypothetical protein